MRKLIRVTLKTGKIINVFDNEIPGLERAGKLADPKKKEEKSDSQIKDEKDTGETKDSQITTKNIKGKTPKKD